MSNNIFLLVLLLFSMLLPLVKSSKDSIGCYVPGRCEDGQTVDFSSNITTPSDCLNRCNITEGCNHFTFEPIDNYCLLFSDCHNLTETYCPDCISGDKSNCTDRKCFRKGKCNGEFLDIFTEENKDDCFRECGETDGCEFFTFDEVGKVCFLTESCEVVGHCETCVHGEWDCDLEPKKDYSKIFIVGGHDCTSTTSDSELVDLASSTSECRKPTEYPIPIEGSVIGLVESVIWVCGGDWLTSLCYNYDFDERAWKPALSSMKEPRFYASSVVRKSGTEMWVVGGLKGSEIVETNYLDTTEFLVDGEFRYGPDLPEAMAYTCLVNINSSHVFLAGGRLPTLQASNKVYIIDLDKGNGWRKMSSMTTPRCLHTCSLVRTEKFGDEIIVIGGVTGQTTTEIFSLKNLKWRKGPNFPHSIQQASAVPFQDSFLLIGGYSWGQCRDEIYKLDLENWNWDERSCTLMKPRRMMAAVMIPDELVECD